LDKVRIYVYVEQKDAGYLKTNYPVEITLTEQSDVKIKAAITRIAGELDPKTRMMLTEIDLSNTNNQIIPGSYVQVHILSPAKSQLEIPREALVVRDGKYFVCMIGADTTIHSQQVKIGANSGDKITILEGITETEALALNVGAQLAEGQKVRIQQ
jgi:membrane fusion protein, multidrug efflux system